MASEIEHLREQLDKEREANGENRRLLVAGLERIRAIESSPDNSDHNAPPEPSEADVSTSAKRRNGTRCVANLHKLLRPRGPLMLHGW
jgi:hypothetical protein